MRSYKMPIGLALFVLVQGPTVAVLRGLLSLLPLPAKLSARWQWKLRKGFWNNFARFKFKGSKPQDIPIPWGLPKAIAAVPFTRRFRKIPIANVLVADRIPWDEKKHLHQWLMRFFTWFQVSVMYRILSPMQAGLDPIAADPYEALDQAYPDKHRALFEPPIIPLEYLDSIDLGALAVRGPYHSYIKKYHWGRDAHDDGDWDINRVAQDVTWNAQHGRCEDHLYQWDFRDLTDANYEHHKGLYELACRVLFVVDHRTRTMRAGAIRHAGVISRPGDVTWQFAKTLALCAATTHMSLVTHYNGIHLASVAHLTIATRNHLYPNHVVCRLLWPYLYHTQISNYVVTRAYMVKGGDFETMFSFTHKGMCDLFSSTYQTFDFTVNNPRADAAQRGIVGGGFDTPMQDDLQRLFDLFRQQARDYLRLYYDDPTLQNDLGVTAWLGALNKQETDPNTQAPIWRGIPGGVGLNANRTLDDFASLLASVMYLVTVRHDLCGSFLWNYQSWPHKQPPRLYRNGQRLPVDVYQRLMNANFNLNVPRTPLLSDPRDPERFFYLASDRCGLQGSARAVWSQFQVQLDMLDTEWRTREPWQVWRVYPSMLEVNISD